MTYQAISNIILANSGLREWDENEPHVSYKESYDQFAQTLSELFREAINKTNIRAFSLTTESGIQASLVSLTRSSQYRLKPEETVLFCYQYLNTSVYEFMSNSIRGVSTNRNLSPIPLSSNLNTVVDTMSHLDMAQKDKILQQIQKMWLKARLDADYNPSIADIIKERYTEICADTYANLFAPLGPTPINKLRLLIIRMFNEPSEPKKNLRISISNILALACLTGKPIDYFMVSNYAQYLPVSYRPEASAYDQTAKEVVVTDPKIKSIIEHLLTVPKDLRAEMIGFILSQCWAHI